MRCKECGRTLAEDAQFCKNCGARTPAETRSEELVRLASSAGLVDASAEAGVPAIPEPAEAAAGDPDIPEPAPIPGEEQQAADLAAPVPPAPGEVSQRAHEALEQKRREAAAIIAGAADAELAERRASIKPPTHSGISASLGYEPVGGVFGEPVPPPPPPPEQTEHISIAQMRRERADAQPVPTQPGSVSGSRCCAIGCVTLFVVLFVISILTSIVAQHKSSEEEPPRPSASAPAVERTMASVAPTADTARAPGAGSGDVAQATAIPAHTPAESGRWEDGPSVLPELRQRVG